jgi:small subunit ribosomal protein S17
MNNRRRIVGVVTSNKMTKTVVVEITRVFRHPLYRKVVHSSKRVKAHDEIGCQIGDQVQIVESRPMSRDKRWVVENVIKKEIRTADTGVADLKNEVLTEETQDTEETEVKAEE